MDLKCLFCLLCFSLSFLSVESHPGIGLVFDGDHNIYYTDLNHVWQLDTESGEARIYVENVHTHELARDWDGNLYGEHYWYKESEEEFWQYIWRKGLNGNLEKIRGDQKGENQDFSFVRDRSFASYEIQPKNGLYQIVKRDSIAQISWHTIDLNRPGWSFVTPGGELLFSDYPSVYSATQEGVAILVKDLSASRFPFSLQDKTHHMYGIWLDRTDAVYVALYGGRQVMRITSEGKIERVFRTGLLWSPVNGVFDKDDQLWLMEARMDGAVRVRMIDKEQLTTGASFSAENIVLFISLLIILGIILLFSRYIRRRRRGLNTQI